MSFYKDNIFCDKVFYHIYPLGLANAAKNNDFCQSAGNFFRILETDLDRIRDLGCNALYLGPIFESTKHGFDTLDYFYVDRRLGNNQDFREFCNAAHSKGFVIVLDAVFNHTGRDFFAFKDIIQNGEKSGYKNWYMNLDFSKQNSYGDCFDYEGWAGCKDLVKLNLCNQEVVDYILSAVDFWIKEFGIDGLRLDAADVMDKSFFEKLHQHCKSVNKNFWLMGEIVHGDYNQWCNEKRIDSVTNYQIYNSLWASLNDLNFYDLSFNLNREFGSDKGLYKYAPLYTFLDNHDVNRVASELKNPLKHLYLVYGLMFTIPGIPSIYYGSEYGLYGKRNSHGDYELRPSLPPFSNIPDYAQTDFDSSFLFPAIRKFAHVRKESAALQKGDYIMEYTSNCQFVFSRRYEQGNQIEKVYIVCNCADELCQINIESVDCGKNYKDMLSGEIISGNNVKSLQISSNNIRIFQEI